MHPLVFLIVDGLVAVALLLWGFHALKRKRLIQNMPTSKVKGVFLGLNEVKGRARRTSPLESPLAEDPVVYYRFDVSEHWSRTVTYTDSKGKTQTRTESGWKTLREGERRPPFRVHDDTGALLVRPRGAEIDCGEIFDVTCDPSDPLYYGKGPAFAVPDSTHERRFLEHAIRQDDRVYVMGVARLQRRAVEPVIAQSRDAEMFLISTKSERELTRNYGWGAYAALGFGTVAAAAFPLGFAMDGWRRPIGESDAIRYAILAGLGYVATVMIYYLVLVYNGLVAVRERMEMARSMIEVQLERRQRLIPNLVACVKGAARHDGDVQERLARLRAEGAQGGWDEEKAARQGAVLRRIVALAETYPELKTDRNFARLQRELVDTEDRIALARGFYNGTVKALNTRVESMPDSLVATITRFEVGDLFAARGFERTPVAVTFDRTS